jgi:thiamine biosynthesis lipoprotein
VGLVILGILTVTRLASPPTPDDLLTFSGPTMGTAFHVKVISDRQGTDTAYAARLSAAIEETLESVNQNMSTYLPDSELSRFNASGGEDRFAISTDTAAVFACALEIAESSGGAFDITVGPLVNAWGFGPNGRHQPPTNEELTALRSHVGYQKLRLDMEASTIQKIDAAVYCDLSALAKGFAVDQIAEALDELGVGRYLVEVGGEIRARGTNQGGESWSVGIEKPVDTGRKLQRAVRLHDVSLATSGDYRNFYERDGLRLSHTIDPRTGRPVAHNLASVSVIHPSCMYADAYATTLMVLGPDDGLAWAEDHGLAALFLVRAGEGFEERATSRFNDEYGDGQPSSSGGTIEP